MRNVLRSLTAVLILATPARPAEAQNLCAEKFPKGGLNLSGQLEGQQIRAFLDVGYPEDAKDGVSGVFIHTNRWLPGAGDAAEIGLRGTMTPGCLIQLTDTAGGSWRLNFTPQGLVGTRTVSEGPASKVTLQVVPAMDCSGRGAWRTYSSRSWPITFEYPTSWRLAETGDSIVLECPNPASIAWGGAPVIVRQGQGSTETRAADGRRGTRVGRFVSFDNERWLVGETCEDDRPGEDSVFCRIARQSVWRGMTVLQGAAGEDRRYRPGGGYVGQGGGIVSYVFLSGDRWVSIDSSDTPTFVDKIGTAGPVWFDGEGVTERLIRSVRRR